MEKQSKIGPAAEAILEADWVKNRPPEDIRPKLDTGYSIESYTVVLFEIRPSWVNPEQIMHHPYAKLRFIKSRDTWELYWLRASGKWQFYQPEPESGDLQFLLDCIDSDSYGCFFG